MLTGVRVTSISGNKVNYVKDGKESSVEGDTIVLALGAKPENQLYNDLRELVFEWEIPNKLIYRGTKMQVQDFQKRLEESFREFLQQMNQEEILLVEKGDEQLWIKLYKTKGEKGFPLKKVAFMLLKNGWVCNKDDRNLLDEDELIVGSFISVDDIPLPILACEISLHFGKYDHLDVDLFPLSKDRRYREIFCEPVKTLRRKTNDLPGLLPSVRNPSLLDEYTSGGMLAGDFLDSLRDKSIPWWFEYVDLYKDFLKNHESYSILKEPTIIEEGGKIKEMLLSKYRKESPRILSDIPYLYSEENGEKLGELLFY